MHKQDLYVCTDQIINKTVRLTAGKIRIMSLLSSSLLNVVNKEMKKEQQRLGLDYLSCTTDPGVMTHTGHYLKHMKKRLH